MKKNKLVLLFSAPILALSIGMSFNKGNSYNSLEIKDKQSIVLFEDSYNIEDFKRDFSKVAKNYEIIDVFNGINNGVLINYDSDFDNIIKSFDGIRGVFENSLNEVVLEGPVYEYEYETFKNPPENKSLKEMNVPSGTNSGENTVIAVIDSSFSLEHNAFQDLDNSVETRLDESDIKEFLNNENKENKVSASLEDCYYNQKIPYYHDYGGSIGSLADDYSNMENYKEDNDVEYVGSTHGMHVSSIASANGDLFNGIAPNSQLLFMKVTVEVGGGKGDYIPNSAIIKAMNDAYLLGADIISTSIGSSFDDFEPFAEEISQNFIEKGIQVNFAVGNEGKGNWENSGYYQYSTTDIVEDSAIGSSAKESWVTAVASSNLSDDSLVTSLVAVDNELVEIRDQIVNYISTEGETKYDEQLPMHVLIPEGEDSVTFEYEVIPNLGDVSDYNGIDVDGKIAIVRRGELNFSEKIKNAKDAGAVGIIITNGEGSGSQGYFDLTGLSQNDMIPAASSSYQAYDIFNNADVKEITISRDMMSSFSTNGTSANLNLKPDISAPGQNIIGAVNSVNNTLTYDSYQYMTGTSMATPNLSGAESVILGEKEFATEEERVEYLKTLKSRVMSNSTVLFEANGAPYSPRVQGAGVVNVGNTISSNMYLEDDTDSSGAKVELRNNEDIQNGIIDFSVTLHNEESKSGSYKASLYVTAPHLTFYDSEGYDYSDNLMLSTEADLLDVYTFDVSLNGETQVIDVHYELSDEIKNELNENFQYGTYIEGFLILESESSDLTNLSIPYMGFYQDFSEAPAVEPFDFEKEEGKLYQSTLLNSLGRDTGLGLTNTNFTSNIYTTTGGLNGLPGFEDVISNLADPDNVYKPIGYNLTDGNYTLYAGTSTSNTLYIQQFVNRSVIDNTITLTNSNGEVVLTDHMFNVSSDGESEDGTYPLYKTSANPSYLESGIIADRAYTIIPLKDKESDSFYEDGIYQLKFEYVLVDGTVQEKEYTLEINSVAKDVFINGFEYQNNLIKIIFSEKVQKVTLNGITLEDLGEDAGSSFEYTLETHLPTIYLSIEFVQGGSIGAVINENSDYILYGSQVREGYTYDIIKESSEYSGYSNQYSIRVFNQNGGQVNITESGNFYLAFKNNTPLEEVVAGCVRIGKVNEVDVFEEGEYKIFKLTSNNLVTNVAPETSSQLYMVIIIASVGTVVVIGIVVAVILITNKKKKK